MKQRIFLTGATGFLGSYLCRLALQQGYHVSALKREHSNLSLLGDAASKIEWKVGDILDTQFLEKAIKGADFVFHCAAIVSFSPKEKQKMMDINVQGTANIVNACLHHQISKLIHVSSIAAIGRPKHQNIITETTKWEESKLNTDYAKSKFLAELEVWRGKEEGLSIGIVNPSIILGAGFWNSGSCKLFKTVQDGLKFYPLGYTGFVDVRDVAKAMLLMAQSDKNGERYIINGINTSYRNLFSTMARHLNVKAPYIKVNSFLRNVAWRVEKLKSLLTGKHPFITKDTALISSLSYQYDNSKSLQELQLQYIPLEKTIQESCQSLISYSNSGKISLLDFKAL